MGMFDTMYSSFDLGEHFTSVELQTKDIDNTMSHYWLDPRGYLYIIDYSHTADFVEIKEGEIEYNSNRLWCNFKWVPNGNRGKISPCMITDYVVVYPSNWAGKWEDHPRCRIHFKYGRLIDYEDVTGR